MICFRHKRMLDSAGTL